MSSKATYVQGAVTLVLVFLILYLSSEFFAFPSKQSAPYVQTNDANWKGWANVDNIFSFGDSYTATGFDPKKQQPSLSDPLGNPTYNPTSPYLKWIQYLTMTYNDSKVETYNFAVHGATVDKGLIDRGSSLSTQVGEKFLPNYHREGTHAGGDEVKRRSRRRRSKSRSNSGGLLADWEPETTLFSVWFGINDNVFSNKSEALFDRVFESYNKTLHQLHAAGAQNFLLLNVPPINHGPKTPKSSPLAKSIPAWNARLATLAAVFGSTDPEISVFLFDAHGLFNRILDAPADFGPTRHLSNLTDQCDGYVRDVTSQETYKRECGVPFDQYFWRDGLHVTFPVHQVLAAEVAGLLRRV